MEENKLIIYTAADGHTKIDVKLEDGELSEEATCRKFRQVRQGGSDRWSVKCLATERLKEYMIKGFTLDDERLKSLGGGNYFAHFNFLFAYAF